MKSSMSSQEQGFFMRGASPSRSPAEGSFFWYDLETSGTHPASDRIMQFAGRRTDAELRAIGEPHRVFLRLAEDVLPSPEACLVTGFTPQRVAVEGVDEWQALSTIQALLRQPDTCVAGYNNLRFDDEFLRHGFYRNLLDPYCHEWQDGNSRWDLIDLVRAAGALRPEGIHWPTEDGVASFRLGALSAANGIPHDGPHDALSDVEATIALARLVKEAQPKLWRFALQNRSRQAATDMLLPLGERLCVHVSQRFSNERYCTAPVVSVAMHPDIESRVIVVDLSQDVSMLLECDAAQLAERLFGPREDDAPERPPLETVVLNRCPFLAPINVVRPPDAERLGFDFDAIDKQRRLLAAAPDLAEKVAAVFRRDEPRAPPEDAEFALYDAFVEDADKATLERLQTALAGKPERWPGAAFDDGRLRVLTERLKARLRPAELDANERNRWDAHVRQCLLEGFGRRLSLAEFEQEVAGLLAANPEPGERHTLNDLADFARSIPIEQSERCDGS